MRTARNVVVVAAGVAAGLEVVVADITRRRQAAGGVDDRARAEQDAVAVDDEDAAVGIEAAKNFRRSKPADHAIENDRTAVRLIEPYAPIWADIERMPVDDGVLAILVDDDVRRALVVNLRRTADDVRAFGPAHAFASRVPAFGARVGSRQRACDQYERHRQSSDRGSEQSARPRVVFDW